MAITCRQAIDEVFAEESGILHMSEVIERIYAKHPDRPWKENSISAHLIGLSVNHSSSRHHPSLRSHAFLFSLGGGRYRRWNPAQDGTWEVTDEGVRLVDPSEEVEEDVEGPDTVTADTSLSLERDLERNLVVDLGRLESGLRLYQEGDISGRQLYTGVVGRIDMLCIDQNDDFVIVELKAGRVDDRVCGQVLRYMGWVQENLAGNREVRGIIVANEFTESLKYAAIAMPHVALKKYEVRFEFTEV